MLMASVASDIVVMGSDPEMADMSNPSGNLYGLRYYVVVTNTKGDRWAHDHGFKNEVAAEMLAKAVQKALDAGKKLDSAHWTEHYPVYGSDAYVAYGQADQVAWERNMED